jgi:single-strand DNA-binding protein
MTIIINLKPRKKMNTLRNKVQLIGFMGKDADVRHLDNGKVVASLTLATSESYINTAGKKITDTQWHNLVAWGKTAEIIEKYTQKGSEIAIEGKLVNRTYEDKEGIKRYITEIIISDLLLIGAKKTDKQAA